MRGFPKQQSWVVNPVISSFIAISQSSPLPVSVFSLLTPRSTYSPHDDSLNAVMAIALQNFKVKHIVITVSIQLVTSHPQGHSNCVGCNTALNVSRLPPVGATSALQRYVAPLATLARVLATENGPPTLDMLIEENVVQQVKNLSASSTIKDVGLRFAMVEAHTM
jgi:carbonic anhydrase